MSPHRKSRISSAILTIGALAALHHTTTVDARPARSEAVQSRPTGPPDGSGVAQISAQRAKEWSARNLEAVIALYADDAVFLPATGSRVTGRAAIRDLFEKALAANPSELHLQSKVTEQSGNLAYDSGDYEEKTISGGITRSGRGNYLAVFRRDGRNQWRIVEHMWTDVPTMRP